MYFTIWAHLFKTNYFLHMIMKNNIFLAFCWINSFAFSTSMFFLDQEIAIKTLDNVYFTATLGNRHWQGLSSIEVIEDLRIWGEHFCEFSEKDKTKTATQCFQLIEFYLTGGFGFDTQATQTTSDNLSLLKAIATAINYGKYLNSEFFQHERIELSHSILEQELKHIKSMVAVAKVFCSDSQTMPDNFSKIQAQWFEFLTIDNWLLHSAFNSNKTIDLDFLPTQSYIEFFGTPNHGVEHKQENNNGFGWLSNFYISGGNNPNSAINESLHEKIALSVCYGKHIFKAFNVETLHHMHKMVIAGKFKNLSEVETFSSLIPEKSLKTCRAIVKKADYDLEDSDKHMQLLLKQKYFNNKCLGKLFLSLGHTLLFEGNKWNDPTWGMCFTFPTQFNGANKLGKMLSRIKKELMYEYSTNIHFRNFINGKDDTYLHVNPARYSEIIFEHKE